MPNDAVPPAGTRRPASLFRPESVVDALTAILPHPAALHEPEFAGNEWAYVKECLDSGWVSSAGEFVDRFEAELAEFTGAGHAVATVNGTAALHICLKLAGVEPGDEVLVPALTFVATANAVAYCHALPHFVDSEARTLGVDPAKLDDYLGRIAGSGGRTCINRASGRRIGAMVCMHTYGHPVDLDPLVEVCRRFGLVLIEDAAESLGSYYKGAHTGNHGLLSALSFNGNKVVTTGGGGAILTSDAGLAERAKHLTTTAKRPHRWEYLHDEVGHNYRMPNINAALGCAQLEQLPGFLERKRKLAERYRRAFAPLSGVGLFVEPEFARSNYWLNALILDREHAGDRDRLLERSNAQGIMTRPVWQLMHRTPMYRDCPRMDLSTAEDLSARLINLPSSPRLVAGADAAA